MITYITLHLFSLPMNLHSVACILLYGAYYCIKLCVHVKKTWTQFCEHDMEGGEYGNFSSSKGGIFVLNILLMAHHGRKQVYSCLM